MFLLLDEIANFFLKIVILMVAGIYHLVSGLYQIFLVLAKTNIFKQDMYIDIASKVYIILAVAMLFVLAYNFITLIVDPDKNKGGKTVEKLLGDSVKVLILIVLCPSLFTLAFDLQDAVLTQQTITKFFTISESGESNYDAESSIQAGGRMMAARTFAAFFAPANDKLDPSQITSNGNMDSSTCGSKTCSLQQALEAAEKDGNFRRFTAFADNWREGSEDNNGVDFSFLIAMFAGGYLIYVLLSFCLDLAIRVIKLAFYQIIAPICIACKLIPNQDSIFKNWWKAVSKTYISVFIRIFIMNMTVFLLVKLAETDFWNIACKSAEGDVCSKSVSTMAYAFLIMGLVTFVKQSSKLIDEIFGLGDVKLGITDKLKEGGFFTGGAAIGAGVKGTIHGASTAASNFKGWKGMSGKKRAGAVAKALPTTFGRTLSSMKNSLSASTNSFGFNALKKEMNSMKDNAGQAVQDADLSYGDRMDKKDLWFGETGILKGAGKVKKAQARIEELQAELKNKTATIKNANDLFIELQKINNLDTDLLGLNQKKAELLKRQSNKNLTEEERKNVESELREIDNRIISKKQEINASQSRKVELQTKLNDIQTEYESKYHVQFNNDLTTEEGMQELINNVKSEELEKFILEKEVEDSRYTQWKADTTTKIKQFVTGIDLSKAQEVVTKYNDGIKSVTTKVQNKHSSEIIVSVKEAVAKQADLSPYAEDIAKIYKGKSVQEINQMASQLNIAQSYEEVAKILGKEVSDKIGLSENNFVKMKGAFVNAIQEPYQKDVNKALSDAITLHSTTDENGVNIFKDNAAALNVLSDLDAEDVARQAYAYNVAVYEIFGPDGVKDENNKEIKTDRSKGRKDLEDYLRRINAPNDRAKSVAKVMGDVKNVNTKGDKKGN